MGDVDGELGDGGDGDGGDGGDWEIDKRLLYNMKMI